jgi:hypothetical protein
MIERRGKLEDLDRSFDIEFWQSLTPQVRFEAMGELIIQPAKTNLWLVIRANIQGESRRETSQIDDGFKGPNI